MKKLVLFGTGGLAREVHELVEDLVAQGAPWDFLGFLDGETERVGTTVHDFPVLGDASWMSKHPDVWVSVPVGGTAARRRIVEALKGHGASRFASLIHPSAQVGRRVEMGEGVTICAGAILTTDIKVEDHVFLNLDCTVGHDSVLGAYGNYNPGVHVSGNVTAGEGVTIGTGACLIQGLSVGEGAIVGAGAVVVRDLPANVTAVGAPAKPIKNHDVLW